MWVWSHDPEGYAYENFEKAATSIKNDVPFAEEDSYPPNYPPGYKFEPWSIEQIMDDMRAGRPVELGAGNWD